MAKIQSLADSPGKLVNLLFTLLRITIGWHFLFEGISKLATPGWSSAPYLMESKWLFSGFFHWIVSHPSALAFTDFLNIWGLILVGTGLFLGLFTRLSAWAGILMLLFYYVANPPFIPSSVPAQGHFFLVNINVIEAAVLLIIAFLNRDRSVECGPPGPGPFTTEEKPRSFPRMRTSTWRFIPGGRRSKTWPRCHCWEWLSLVWPERWDG